MIYTLGYQLRDIDEYVALVSQAGADVVVDVRETPWSRKRGFSKSSLVKHLSSAGIDYVHAGFAGNPKRFRSEAESREQCLRKYRGYVYAKDGILEKVDDLLQGLLNGGKTICLLCYERHPEDCHRSVLLDAWRQRFEPETAVTHLGSEGAPRFTASS